MPRNKPILFFVKHGDFFKNTKRQLILKILKIMKKILFRMLLLIALSFTACQQSDTLGLDKNATIVLTHDQIEQILFMKEVSLAIGNAMKDKNASSFLVNLVKLKNDNSESISLAALIGDEPNIPANEQRLLQKFNNHTNKNNNIGMDYFIKQLLITISDNPILYPLISKDVIVKNTIRKGTDDLNLLRDKLATKNLEIYLPYETEFNWDSISEVTVTWHPLVRDDWNEGNLIDMSSIASKSLQISTIPVSVINETYAANNPTVIVKPIDIYNDIGGNHSNPIGAGLGTGGGGTDGFTPTTRWVTTNLDYTVITEKDVLSTFLPKVRLTDSYRGLFGGSSKITIYRGSAGLKLNAAGYIVPSESAIPLELLTVFGITRHQAKRQLWQDVNINWDDDWDVHENDEAFILVTKEPILQGSTLTVKGKVNIGYDVAKQEATFEPTATIDYSFNTASHSKLRYNNQLSRRGVLSNVVGNNGAGTINDDGIDYTIRTADKLQYYFKHKWTHVAQ